MSCLYRKIDYKGKIVGCYEVLSFDKTYTYPSGQKRDYWNVKCIHCGTEKTAASAHVVGKNQSGCSVCVRKRFSGIDSFNWKTDCKNVTGMYFRSVEASARNRNIEFKISREEMEEQFVRQNGKCYYTGFDLYFGQQIKRGTASLDRIDSLKGYTKDNVRWVYKDVNRMKWDLSHEQFLEICKLITEKSKNDDEH